ncbi:hypothetical protein PC116_g19014 [Phytophthora cactorum]|uniref:Uncharacterized protein n=1 Tax=Phytophthora cactorum TaxID=29920 RepID=A0A8T1CNH7_9STRA|nr:hypothetical protein Pcac1_g2466 [Phytophthora cactorum]KAG3113303.1 hypothetical protein PI125_g7453 [Phytophthora idaei]KAG2923708.1 hypothetical protein PC117_g15654 [Phytophthora cactorum]KAG2935513.1 hypothetical protein PC114_g456 [Phytophthora cactorum]KAG3004895.1 hypothetical protein PC119_g15461 [Phytophthora cactorum]
MSLWKKVCLWYGTRSDVRQRGVTSSHKELAVRNDTPARGERPSGQ